VKSVMFYKGKIQSDDLLHIETEGCVVNIRVGLHDPEGREVTAIEILTDYDPSCELDGSVNNRVIKKG